MVASKVLRWTKSILLRVSKSYRAQAFVLFLLPLWIGIILGFGLAKITSASSPTTTDTTSQGTTSPTTKIVVGQVDKLDGGASQSAGKNNLNSSRPNHGDSSSMMSSNDDTVCGKDMEIDQLAEEDDVAANDCDDTGNSGVPLELLPRHVAVIMDGNRRYARRCTAQQRPQHEIVASGHEAGARQVLEFCRWCLAEGRIQQLTIYAFSTENWQRDPIEIAALMKLFTSQFREWRRRQEKRKRPLAQSLTRDDDDEENKPDDDDSHQDKIRVRFHVTDPGRLPRSIRDAMQQLEDETRHNYDPSQDGSMILNICLSYGSRQELVQSCQSLARQCCVAAVEQFRNNNSKTLAATGLISKNGIVEEYITEESLMQNLSIPSCPDLLIRTSGEYRLSNFLLWQLAYTELFFLRPTWPELTRKDFYNVLRQYALQRQRRFGK